MEQDLREDLEIQRVREVVWIDGWVCAGVGGCDVHRAAREGVLEDGKHGEVIAGIFYRGGREEGCNVPSRLRGHGAGEVELLSGGFDG